jgi:hypothetical protein
VAQLVLFGQVYDDGDVTDFIQYRTRCVLFYRRPINGELDDNIMEAKLHILEIIEFIMDMRVDFIISQLLSLYKVNVTHCCGTVSLSPYEVHWKLS